MKIDGTRERRFVTRSEKRKKSGNLCWVSRKMVADIMIIKMKPVSEGGGISIGIRKATTERHECLPKRQESGPSLMFYSLQIRSQSVIAIYFSTPTPEEGGSGIKMSYLLYQDVVWDLFRTESEGGVS